MLRRETDQIFTSMESANDRTCFLQESVMQARRQQIMTVLEVDFMGLIHPTVSGSAALVTSRQQRFCRCFFFPPILSPKSFDESGSFCGSALKLSISWVE